MGHVLHPLSDLERLFPTIAARARRKYEGREWLPSVAVPALSCRWMDCVMFTPVHPKQVRDALVAAGHPRFPRQWIEIAADRLSPDRTTAFLPGDSPADDAFLPFSLQLLASHARLSAAQRAAYAGGAPGDTLLFDHTLHVLHHGSVPFDPSHIVTV